MVRYRDICFWRSREPVIVLKYNRLQYDSIFLYATPNYFLREYSFYCEKCGSAPCLKGLSQKIGKPSVCKPGLYGTMVLKRRTVRKYRPGIVYIGELGKTLDLLAKLL